MGFFFIVLGLAFLISAIRGTQSDMFLLLKSEFSGPQSFFTWASALLILGCIGYIKPVRPIADGMMVLILLVIVLKNQGGVFSQFNEQLRNPATATPGKVTTQ